MKMIFAFLLSVIPFLLTGQVAEDSDWFKTLQEKDSLLFTIGFNTCDIAQFENLVSEDAEFFHDQSGMLKSKAAFIQNIKEGICTMPNKPRRALVDGSLKVYLMKNQGEVYGALQTGEHQFFLCPNGGEEILTSTAKFSHIWLLEDGQWRLSRIISYDHVAPGH